jgi:pyruvate/2-oxoglutarate/acetoin dehydrogenase E1 component/TPP-dependent pyruvate/acetoin dehydrogenase alpha subunit
MCVKMPKQEVPMPQAKEQTNLGIEPGILLQIYQQMSRIHEVDKAMRSGLSGGRFQFTYWPMTGQEAIPATLAALTDSNDYMVTIYRGIHDQVAKGVPLKGLFAEAMARKDGLNKGKGGSPHISDPASGSMLTTAIVGGGAPIANGLALAAKMRGEGRVTVVNFGDGATSIGAVHEAMNLAGVWQLPIIFLCQNNQIGEYTKIPDYTASPDFAGRAAGYGFRGVRVDANDPIAFHAVMKDVVESVRDGKGPVFVEAVTLRLGTHAGFAPNELLSKEQLEAGRADWPVPKTRALLLAAGISTEDELAAIDAAAAAEVAEAVAFATASAPIDEEDMFNDVYADVADVPRRGVHPVRSEELPPTGETKLMAMYEAIISAQDLALAADPGVFLLGEDIGDPPGGVFKTTAGLQTKWGKERVRPTPIAEQAIIGAATGAALVGMRPVAEIMFCDFIGVTMDQIANHAAKQRYMSGGATNVPMTMRILCAGGLGGFGAQHSQSLESWLLHVPGLKVVYPSTTLDARGLLTSCIFDDDPCVHLESMALVFGAPKQEVPVGDYRIPLGVAKVRREGTDISLISFGWQVNQCMAAAEELAKEGVSAEVIDLRSLMPLDYHRVLDSVKKTRRALVVHAATEFCGLGSEIASTINEELFSILKAPASRFGAYYTPISFSKAIEAAQMPNKNSIVLRIREVMKG